MSNFDQKPDLSEKIDNLVSQLRSGKRRAVARLISYIEDYGAEVARKIVSKVFKNTGKAYIIGITGAPGSGKSTLTNRIAMHYLQENKKVSVICVDPTSPFSGGALLGDRIRMKDNFCRKNLFIRSMANRGKLGGLAHTTKDVLQVLDAYGSDIILLETVGVGQSEIDVFKSAHTTCVVVNPGTGDDIQAIKAGIMEITDVFVVNKMDLAGADKKVNDLQSMLDLSDSIEVDSEHHCVRVVQSNKWRPSIVKTNARTGENIEKLVDLIEKHGEFLEKSKLREQRLNYRYKHYVVDILKTYLSRNIENLIFSQPEIDEIINRISSKEEGADPYNISDEILKKFVHRL